MLCGQDMPTQPQVAIQKSLPGSMICSLGNIEETVSGGPLPTSSVFITYNFFTLLSKMFAVNLEHCFSCIFFLFLSGHLFHFASVSSWLLNTFKNIFIYV